MKILNYIMILLITDYIVCDNSKNSLLRKDKVRRLSACMKVSKTRQNQDNAFYSNLIRYVEEFSTSENKVGDFIALTIVTCYKEILDKQAIKILEDNQLDSMLEEYKELLKLEWWYDLYRAERIDEVENEILKMQEKVLEVVSLSKDADILQNDYYNIMEKENESNKIGFIESLITALFSFIWNTNGELGFELSFVNFIYLFVFLMVLYLIVDGLKQPAKKKETVKAKEYVKKSNNNEHKIFRQPQVKK